jgi:hypothetical protein
MAHDQSPLSALDDYPLHQVAQPMRHVGTSDRNFYDRYYFNGFSHDGSAMFIMGLGVYPNLGVMDSFLVVLTDGQHRVVRSSRELDGADRLAPSVGPLSIEVLEPLRRLRVRCAPNEWGVDLDATWTGSIPAHPEPPHQMREHGRAIFDSYRMAQTGGWDGTLTTPEGTFTLTDATWWGTRDRSWGVRPVGEAEPPGIRAQDPPSWFWIYAPIRFADHSIILIMQETVDGTRILEEAVRIDADGTTTHLGRPDHDLTFAPGTRRATGGTLTTSGDPLAGTSGLVITAEALIPLYVGIGTGYGFDADWRHGMWQGPQVTQGVHIDTTTPEGAARLMGIVDSGARFTYHDGTRDQVGYGLFETMVIGPHERYGFADLFDGWGDTDKENS